MYNEGSAADGNRSRSQETDVATVLLTEKGSAASTSRTEVLRRIPQARLYTRNRNKFTRRLISMVPACILSVSTKRVGLAALVGVCDGSTADGNRSRI